jgi:hypothetical protein
MLQGILVRRKYALTPRELFQACWEVSTWRCTMWLLHNKCMPGSAGCQVLVVCGVCDVMEGLKGFRACLQRELILVSRNLFLYGFRYSLPTFFPMLFLGHVCPLLALYNAYLRSFFLRSLNQIRLLRCPQSWNLRRRFFVTMLMAVVTATLFLRTNLHPDSVEAGNLYFSVIFFSLISLMFDGFADETLTVTPPLSLIAFHAIAAVVQSGPFVSHSAAHLLC